MLHILTIHTGINITGKCQSPGAPDILSGHIVATTDPLMSGAKLAKISLIAKLCIKPDGVMPYKGIFKAK